MKIKYQGAITRYLAIKTAQKNKRLFEKTINECDKSILTEIPCGNSTVPVQLISYSSRNDFLEQQLSILSFCKYVGIPHLWTIYSDGTHTDDHVKHLQLHFPFVKIVQTSLSNPDTFKLKGSLEPFRDELLAYARSPFPLGKKLLFFLNHEATEPCIFLDSDILFYSQADKISMLSEVQNGWFLPEWLWGTLDNTYKNLHSESVYQVNSGFFYQIKELDCTQGLQYLKMLNGKYEYFTEQTIFHIILKDNNYFPLDPRIYFLNNNDQFDWNYNFKRSQIAIRHYTSPVRHKMWQRDWKWHLSIQS